MVVAVPPLTVEAVPADPAAILGESLEQPLSAAPRVIGAVQLEATHIAARIEVAKRSCAVIVIPVLAMLLARRPWPLAAWLSMTRVELSILLPG